MDLYYLAGGGGSGGSSSGGGGGGSSRWIEASMRRRRRLSSPSPSAFLAPAFNAAASGDSVAGGGSSGSSSGFLDLDDSLLRFRRPHFSHSSTSPSSVSSTADSAAATRRKLLRLLLRLRSPPPPPLAEDEVLVMDGVLVSGSGSNRSRSVSNCISAGMCRSLSVADFGSCSGGGAAHNGELCRSWEVGGCRYGSKCQFAHGKEELRGVRHMKPKSSEMDWMNGRSVPSTGSNLQGPKTYSFPPPSPAGAALSTAAAGGATNSIKLAADSSSPKATIMTTEPDSSTPKPEVAQTFTWPPTEEEDACINQVLYGPSRRRRLPIFKDICPE